MKTISQLIYVEPNGSEGFNFGYFIKIFQNSDSKNLQLIGEGNNCGVVNSAEDAYKLTLWEIEFNGLVCRRLQSKLDASAIIMPCFTRPTHGESNIYTHMLTSQAIKTSKKDIKRVDKQYANMVLNAKKVLTNLGYSVSDKSIMTSFSASSKFAQRFALLYPEMVSCVIAAGMSAVPCLPVKELNGHKLNYPLGVNDYEKIMGKPFNANAYKKIKQYLFMGDLDENDPVKYDDCFTSTERQIIYDVLDENIQKRWVKMVEVIKTLKLKNTHTYLIKGVAHSPHGMDKILNEQLHEILGEKQAREEIKQENKL